MKIIFCFILLTSGFISTFGQQFTHRDSLRGHLNENRKCFDVTFYDLNIDFNLTEKSIRGNNTIHYTAVNSHTQIQLDLFPELKIDSVKYLNKLLNHTRDSFSFLIHFNKKIEVNEKVVLTVFYHGIPKKAVKAPWDGGFVYAKDSLNRPWVGVACEGLGASSWWPLKDHLSDEPDSMLTTFTIPKPMMAVGNGRLIHYKDINASIHSYTWAVSYPINSYNVTFNIAQYAIIKDTMLLSNGKQLALTYYVLDYNKQKAEKHFIQVKPILKCYDYYFGPYPFARDGYALVETSYWGMEHQSAISYGNNYKTNFLNFDYIIYHETGHEWWGNNISVDDHAELWLHESFTTYAENLLMEYYYGANTAQLYLNYHKKNIDNINPIIGPRDVNFENHEDSDMYYKGAWILHTLRNYINNDKLWFAYIKKAQSTFGLKTINTNEFIIFTNTYFNQNLNWFFNQYLYHAACPKLLYSLTPIKKKKNNWELTYKWNNTVADFVLPITITTEDGQQTITPSNKNQLLRIKITKKNISQLFNLDKAYYCVEEIN
jgi:aminopeptidase N